MYKFFLFFLIISNIVVGRDFTKPPSVALRTELSYVCEVLLTSKKIVMPDKMMLSFILSKNLHNHSANEINILVTSSIAQNLALDVKYIISYQKLRKTKINGIVKYIPNIGGLFFINVEGANPAIFRTNELLIKQLTSSPQIAQSNPDLLIKDIFKGMLEKDPKIQEFFVRELINWDVLHKNLDQENFQQLYEIYNSTDATLGTMTAILEPRPFIHKALGHIKIAEKVLNILKYSPVNIDAASQKPTLILQALKFVSGDKPPNWNILSRWTRSNIPTITEQVLLMMEKIDSIKAVQFAKSRILDTSLSDASRRVLIRFISTKERNIDKV